MNSERWREGIFDEVVRLNRGFDLPNYAMREGPFPVVASSSIKGTHAEYRVKGPGVVTGRSGTLGVVQYVPGEFWPLNTTLYAKDFRGNDPRFVYYFLTTMRLANYNAGAGVPTLNQNHLQKLSVKIPDVTLQSKIAEILASFDDLIDINRKRGELIHNLADELYREWFVRRRFPGHQSVNVVNGVPEAWETKRFGDFCTLKRGYDLPNSAVRPGEFPVIASTSIKTFHEEFKVEPPVITTGRSGSLGEVLLVNERAWPLNTSLYVKNFHGNSSYLIYYTLKNMHLENFNSGAGVPTLNRNHLSGISMAVPDKPLQKRFDTEVSVFWNQVDLIDSTIEKLATLRELFLYRLVSGRLDIEQIDIRYRETAVESSASEEELVNA